jgi:hypothetical protein
MFIRHDVNDTRWYRESGCLSMTHVNGETRSTIYYCGAK